MRLGCEVTAADINPVAWFILKCTLEYPQRLAGQHRPLPEFAVESPEFMEAFLKGTSKPTKKQLQRQLEAVQQSLFPPPDVDLAWHVRAWGHWVLERAKADLAPFYPVIEAKPTVAYLWARTAICKNCRATIPLLKTRWLSKKDDNRVLLTMHPKADRTGVDFGIEREVPLGGGNSAQRREADKRAGQGTMARNGAWCPCCGQPGTVAMQMEDIRQEGVAGRLGTQMTVVVVGSANGKGYRLPVEDEIRAAANAASEIERVYAEIPFGIPTEPLPSKEALGFRVPLYGIDQWHKLFTPRQLMALGTFVKHTRAVPAAMAEMGYTAAWREAIQSYLAIAMDRAANYLSTVCIWESLAGEVKQTFLRYALPITWDFAEANPVSLQDRYYAGAVSNVGRVLDGLAVALKGSPSPHVEARSAIREQTTHFDIVLTDPPYYDAIPYSDLMDFFYVWLRRVLRDPTTTNDEVFAEPLAPKWDSTSEDGELIDDASRHANDAKASKRVYQNGMRRAFEACARALEDDGRMVVVFANKRPDAWEALVAALIDAGFAVDGAWPIATEMRGGVRNFGRASLASSVWLVCKKRPADARPGWDNRVIEDMRSNINVCLREYWDAGIRGPDFVWAATGPALEPYSRHPVVKKANDPGKTMEVSEFLRAVRRIVVDFVVGRVLSPSSEDQGVSGLDDLTTYYLLHRNDFGLDEAPIGPCILYAVSCGLSDADLADEHDLLARTGGKTGSSDEEEEAAEAEDPEGEVEEGTGSKVRLKTWQQRKAKGMGYDGSGRPAPLIDQVHRLMHLWKAGDQVKVDEYLELHALAGNRLFHRVLQALIELADEGSEERALFESISNHVGGMRPELAAQVPGWEIKRGGQSEEGDGK
jgi:adenine-specific DNA methylase